ncbi:HpcH/HpaI aldolase/citrate lyase family protein [Cupriavidus sp. CP313]
MTEKQRPPRRSVLYVPASNARALGKARSLPCDAIVFDLEEAVAPAMKDAARRNLIEAFAAGAFAGQEAVIRLNALGTREFASDLEVAARCGPDAVLLPKVNRGADMERLRTACSAHTWTRACGLWAMIETADAIHHIDDILCAGRAAKPALDCLVIGTNDLAKETGVFPGDQRQYLLPWLMSVVLAARRHGVAVLDGVWNDFADQAGFGREVEQSVKMAFDGKTLIHPSQVEPANQAFAPSALAVEAARQIVGAFAAPEHAGAGVINLNGRMVERLHLEQATRLLALHDAIQARNASRAA